jgi:hypothetical protein
VSKGKRQPSSEEREARNHQGPRALLQHGNMARIALSQAGQSDTNKKTGKTKDTDHRSRLGPDMGVTGIKQILRSAFSLR